MLMQGKCIRADDTCPNGTYDGTEPFGSGSVPVSLALQCHPCQRFTLF